MHRDEIDEQMRAHEIGAPLRLAPGGWIVVRVDGRSFSTLTAERYDKPFDRAFADRMVAAARALVEELQGAFAYVQSDEISLCLPPDWELFARRAEKIVSLAAGTASAAFTAEADHLAIFDARIWSAARREDVVTYFRWRAGDAARCALQNACYWTLREEGDTARQASERLHGRGASFKNELLFERGINFNDLPVWQRRGVVVRWEAYEKEGYNPVEDREVTVERRRLGVDRQIPMKEAWGDYIEELLDEADAGA
jgi:tRNA(His) 5'-end guanylyltransferase